jgi:tetratricopeptide (TPR) repeat protein
VNAERLRIEDQLAQVEADLAELDEQVEAGEIDEETAAGLRVNYRSEADGLRDRLARFDGAAAASQDADAAVAVPVPGRSRRRMLIGGAILAVGGIVIAAVAITSANSSPSNAVAGVAAEDAEGLASVSSEEMEEVVAANPEIVGMRLALARRYFEAGEFDQAIDHYMIVLEQEQDPEALANVGWMTYLSDRPDVALGYLERAIALEPNFAQAYWFLANIRYALGDTEGAIEPLEQLLAFDAVPDEVRREAEAALAALREEGS